MKTSYYLPIATAVRAEFLKGHRNTPLKLALLMPLILGIPTLVLTGVGGFGIMPTLLWNYWYSLLLPITLCLIASSCAYWETKIGMRAVAGLPVNKAHIFLAKNIYVWLLTLLSNCEIAVLSTIALALGSHGPTTIEELTATLLMTVMTAWIVPLTLILTTVVNVLVGIVIPALEHIALYIALWNSRFWWAIPSSALGRVMQPLIHVLPSGELIEGYTFALTSWQCLTGIGISIALAALLVTVCAHWYARVEVK
ncbi:ABC transporter permease [Alloscardovia venturai]|uniref:ABC transporter permease n=1 Tax=Alloscardovia venturai TaxID=1769421 RepID=A0ABW2Y6V2_9BIFI